MIPRGRSGTGTKRTFVFVASRSAFDPKPTLRCEGTARRPAVLALAFRGSDARSLGDHIPRVLDYLGGLTQAFRERAHDGEGKERRLMHHEHESLLADGSKFAKYRNSSSHRS
jgi:hypothetical protein